MNRIFKKKSNTASPSCSFEERLKTRREIWGEILADMEKTKAGESFECLIMLFEWESMTVESNKLILEQCICDRFICPGSPRGICVNHDLQQLLLGCYGTSNPEGFTQLKRHVLCDVRYHEYFLKNPM